MSQLFLYILIVLFTHLLLAEKTPFLIVIGTNSRVELILTVWEPEILVTTVVYEWVVYLHKLVTLVYMYNPARSAFYFAHIDYG